MEKTELTSAWFRNQLAQHLEDDRKFEDMLGNLSDKAHFKIDSIINFLRTSKVEREFEDDIERICNSYGEILESCIFSKAKLN